MKEGIVKTPAVLCKLLVGWNVGWLDKRMAGRGRLVGWLDRRLVSWKREWLGGWMECWLVG